MPRIVAHALKSSNGFTAVLMSLDEFAYECKLISRDTAVPRLACVRCQASDSGVASCHLDRNLCLRRIISRVISFFDFPFIKEEKVKLLVLTWEESGVQRGVAFTSDSLDDIYVLKRINRRAILNLFKKQHPEQKSWKQHHESWEFEIG